MSVVPMPHDGVPSGPAVSAIMLGFPVHSPESFTDLTLTVCPPLTFPALTPALDAPPSPPQHTRLWAPHPGSPHLCFLSPWAGGLQGLSVSCLAFGPSGLCHRP